jgi:arylsulfatase A-like enzyme
MPNFKRLGEKTAVFDNNYVGSLPCMPARRELHTGRLNFLHRDWTPLEPFDDSTPEILKQNGVYSHLVSGRFEACAFRLPYFARSRRNKVRRVV